MWLGMNNTYCIVVLVAETENQDLLNENASVELEAYVSGCQYVWSRASGQWLRLSFGCPVCTHSGHSAYFKAAL